METTVHRAFDILVIKSLFRAGSTNTIEPLIDNVLQIGSHNEYVWLYTRGLIIAKEKTTGQIIELRKNDCTLINPIPKGEWEFSFIQDFELLCLSPFLNKTKIPLDNKVVQFILPSGESVEIAKDSKLFLGVGVLEIDNKDIGQYSQIKFSSGNKIVKAKTDCYGFFVL